MEPFDTTDFLEDCNRRAKELFEKTLDRDEKTSAGFKTITGLVSDLKDDLIGHKYEADDDSSKEYDKFKNQLKKIVGFMSFISTGAFGELGMILIDLIRLIERAIRFSRDLQKWLDEEDDLEAQVDLFDGFVSFYEEQNGKKKNKFDGRWK